MKKLSFLIFISCLIIFSNATSLYTKLFEKAKEDNKEETKQIIRLNLVNQALMLINDVTVYNSEIWSCTQKNKLMRYGTQLQLLISGNAPPTCSRLAVNSLGDLYVISGKDDGNKVYKFKKISTQSFAWLDLGVKDMSDITVGMNDEIYVVSNKGVISNLISRSSDSLVKFNAKEFGDSCRIAFSEETEETVYLVDKSGNFYRVKSNDITTLYPSVFAKDVCVDNSNTVFVAGSDGIFIKKATVQSFSKVEEGIAVGISCWSNLWLVGADYFLYNSAY